VYTVSNFDGVNVKPVERVSTYENPTK